MASFVHSFRYHCTDHIAKEYRILKRQIFSSQPRAGSDILPGLITTHSVTVSSLRRSRDIYLSYYLSILYIYIIHLFIFIFIFRRPPSAVRRPLPPPFPHFRDTRDLKSLRRKRDYASPISCCCDCPSSGSLIFGGQIVHIKEGKGQLALFSTKDNVLLTSHPSYSSAIDLFSLFLFFTFLFNFHPLLCRPHTDPTLNFFFPPPHYVDHLRCVDCVPFGESKTDFWSEICRISRWM